jgi:hypothetical protein
MSLRPPGSMYDMASGSRSLEIRVTFASLGPILGTMGGGTCSGLINVVGQSLEIAVRFNFRP